MKQPTTPETEAAAPLSADEWNKLLTRVIAPEMGQNLRRNTRRYPVTGEVKLVFERGSGQAKRTFDILNVSRGGLLLKGYDEVAPDTLVDLTVIIGEHRVPLRGRVTHCTGALGGFKIGVKLVFVKPVFKDQ